MNFAFAGTPEFARSHLQELLECRWCPQLVLTQPDRRAGRGRQLQKSPVKQLAEECDLELLQPERIDADCLKLLRQEDIELLVVVAYGLLLPPALFDFLPGINVHASLLPRWRGAAPIEHAIMAGDSETGISIMRMVPALDQGPVLAQDRLEIKADSTADSLRSRLAIMGADMLIECLMKIEKDGWPLGQLQDDSQSCYAGKIDKTMLQLDLRQSNLELDRQIRALAACWFDYRQQRLIVRQARPVDLPPTFEQLQPGSLSLVSKNRLLLHCGQGALELLRIQRPGKNPVNATEMIAYLSQSASWAH